MGKKVVNTNKFLFGEDAKRWIAFMEKTYRVHDINIDKEPGLTVVSVTYDLKG